MKKIALVVRTDTEDSLSCVKEASEFLLGWGCTLYASEELSALLGHSDNVIYKAEKELFSDAECVVVFGGDGTIMRIAHKTRLPILSVNMGRIGYIAELEVDELYMLKELVNDNYTVENRMMLSYTVTKGGVTTEGETPVLNEIMLSKGGYSVMPEVELICNKEEVGKYFCDGLICATPTGSTAYSLAAGGSIVDPGMECFSIAQICPQSFYAKPLIFGGTSVFEFRKGKRGHGRLFLVSDGEYITEISGGDSVTVKKSDLYTRLIKIKKNNFYSVMRSKMTEI